VPLPALPRASSGKLDKRALPEPPDQLGERGVALPRSRAESILCKIFAGLLPVQDVGVDDSFFALGGDSILTIQLVTRARQAGLVLSVKDVFAAPTPAELALLARLTPAADAEQGPISGKAPLTPAQRWFFEQPRENHAHFNQALLFAVKGELDRALLEQTVSAIVRHHDALRLRFVRTAAGVEQFHGPPDDDSIVSHVDLSQVPDDALSATIEARCGELQASFDLENGPLIRVALLELGAGRGSRLLLAAHHLVIDGVSWRIVLEDLESTYRHRVLGKPGELPPKSTSFQKFAERLWEYAASRDWNAELTGFRAQSALEVPALRRDHPDAPNRVGDVTLATRTLSAEDTLGLLQRAPKRWGTTTEACLLSAATTALAELAGGTRMRFMLESHGREELTTDLDVTRTVGWFTAMFPVTLAVAKSGTARDTLAQIQTELALARRSTLAYGLLRYGEGPLAQELRSLPVPEVTFNYLGQTRGTLTEHGLFAPAPESPGPSESADTERPFLLDMTAIVVGGRLRISIHHSSRIHTTETIARVLDRLVAELSALIEACRAEELSPAERFARSRLAPSALDRVLKRQSRKRR
jgi:non-ribosomal peptide synthase protein (TIGR01720 family)